MTTKEYQYLKFKLLWELRKDYETKVDPNGITVQEKVIKIQTTVKELQDKPEDYVAPAFLDTKYPNTFEYNNKIYHNPISLYWIIGFIMAEGCFHITNRKDITFSITQFLDNYVISGIKNYFNIISNLRVDKNKIIKCETQNLHNIGNILQLIDGKIFGMKALELLLFKQAYHYRILKDLDSKVELKRIQPLKKVLAEIRETDYIPIGVLEVDLVEHHKHYEGLYNRIIKAFPPHCVCGGGGGK